MNLTREQLLELYERRGQDAPIAIEMTRRIRGKRIKVTNDLRTWPCADRPLTPAETAYLVPELPEEEQCDPTPP